MSNREAGYLASLSDAEAKRHLAAHHYPSGRHSHGGANRSSSMKREVRLRVTHIPLCVACGGVTPEVAAQTSLFPLCVCVT